MPKQRWKFGINIIAVLGIAMQFGLICYFEWKYFFSYMNADIASDLYLAETLANSGHWLLTEDWLWTSEIHFLHNQLLMVPLFHLFSSYRMVLTISFAIGVLLCILLCIWITFQLCGDFVSAIVSAGLMIAPISVQYEIGFTAMASWPYIFFTLLFWGMLLAWRKKNSKLVFVILLALSVLLGMCGIRFFMIVFAPYILAILWQWFSNNMYAKQLQFVRKEVVECGMIMIGAVIGYGIYHFYLNPAYGGGSASAAFLVGSTEVAENILYTPFSLLQGMGGFRMQNEIASAHGIAQLFVIMSILLIYIVWFASYNKAVMKIQMNEEIVFSRSFMLWALLLNVFLVGFTNMGQIWGRPLECHYIMLALIIMPCVVCALVYKCHMNVLFKYMWILSILIYIIVADLWCSRGGQIVNTPNYAAWLMNQNYDYGVATTWDFGMTTTAYTDGVVEVDYISNGIYDEGQMTRKSNAVREPEFIILDHECCQENKLEELLQGTNLEYEQVYQDELVSILELR